MTFSNLDVDVITIDDIRTAVFANQVAGATNNEQSLLSNTMFANRTDVACFMKKMQQKRGSVPMSDGVARRRIRIPSSQKGEMSIVLKVSNVSPSVAAVVRVLPWHFCFSNWDHMSTSSGEIHISSFVFLSVETACNSLEMSSNLPTQTKTESFFDVQLEAVMVVTTT